MLLQVLERSPFLNHGYLTKLKKMSLLPDRSWPFLTAIAAGV